MRTTDTALQYRQKKVVRGVRGSKKRQAPGPNYGNRTLAPRKAANALASLLSLTHHTSDLPGRDRRNKGERGAGGRPPIAKTHLPQNTTGEAGAYELPRPKLVKKTALGRGRPPTHSLRRLQPKKLTTAGRHSLAGKHNTTLTNRPQTATKKIQEAPPAAGPPTMPFLDPDRKTTKTTPTQRSANPNGRITRIYLDGAGKTRSNHQHTRRKDRTKQTRSNPDRGDSGGTISCVLSRRRISNVRADPKGTHDRLSCHAKRGDAEKKADKSPSKGNTAGPPGLSPNTQRAGAEDPPHRLHTIRLVDMRPIKNR